MRFVPLPDGNDFIGQCDTIGLGNTFLYTHTTVTIFLPPPTVYCIIYTSNIILIHVREEIFCYKDVCVTSRCTERESISHRIGQWEYWVYLRIGCFYVV